MDGPDEQRDEIDETPQEEGADTLQFEEGGPALDGSLTVSDIVNVGNKIFERHVGQKALLKMDPDALPDDLKALLDSEHLQLKDGDLQSHVLEMLGRNMQTRMTILRFLRSTGGEAVADAIEAKLQAGETIDADTLHILEEQVGGVDDQVMATYERLQGMLKSGATTQQGAKKTKELKAMVRDTLGSSTVRNEKGGVGRNSPCPCGSGRKYKQCCLRKQKKD